MNSFLIFSLDFIRKSLQSFGNGYETVCYSEIIQKHFIAYAMLHSKVIQSLFEKIKFCSRKTDRVMFNFQKGNKIFCIQYKQ